MKYILIALLSFTGFLSFLYANWPAGTAVIASAVLEPKSGSDVSGTVDFAKSKTGNTLIVRVYAKNLGTTPHGFHIHEKGDCSSSNASSAGEHFNPSNEMHAGPTRTRRHLGDLGNLTLSKNGTATVNIPLPGTASDGWKEIIGKSIVIHKDKDDLSNQPAGNSGERIACGVIQSKESSTP